MSMQQSPEGQAREASLAPSLSFLPQRDVLDDLFLSKFIYIFLLASSCPGIDFMGPHR